MSQYGNAHCGTFQGPVIHDYEGTPLCTACRVYKEQMGMIDYFNRMENPEDKPDEPRLVSYHFRVKKVGPLDEGTAVPQPVAQDRQVVDFWDRPRHFNVTRNVLRDEEGNPILPNVTIVRAPWVEMPASNTGHDTQGIGVTRGTQSNVLRDVFVEGNGLCHDRTSSNYIFLGKSDYRVPQGDGEETRQWFRSNIVVPQGMDTEQTQLQKRNVEMCNQCPIKGKCTEMALKSTELGSMYGGLNHQERLHLRGIISEGLKSLVDKFRNTTRVFNIARFINGRPVQELPTEPMFIGEVPRD